MFDLSEERCIEEQYLSVSRFAHLTGFHQPRTFSQKEEVSKHMMNVIVVLFSLFICYHCNEAIITFQNCKSQKLSTNDSKVGSSALYNNTYTVIFAGDNSSAYEAHVDGFYVNQQNGNIQSFITECLVNRYNMAFTSWKHYIIFAGGSTNNHNSGFVDNK